MRDKSAGRMVFEQDMKLKRMNEQIESADLRIKNLIAIVEALSMHFGLKLTIEEIEGKRLPKFVPVEKPGKLVSIVKSFGRGN